MTPFGIQWPFFTNNFSRTRVKSFLLSETMLCGHSHIAQASRLPLSVRVAAYPLALIAGGVQCGFATQDPHIFRALGLYRFSIPLALCGHGISERLRSKTLESVCQWHYGETGVRLLLQSYLRLRALQKQVRVSDYGSAKQKAETLSVLYQTLKQFRLVASSLAPVSRTRPTSQ